MATVVVEVGPSEDKTVFSGSSDKDKAYAKTFWQSIQLLPPMESRLVSSDIKQRLKRAPASGQASGKNTSQMRDTGQQSKADRLIAEANERIAADEFNRLQKLSQFREADRALLHKHRQIRIQREQTSLQNDVRPAGSQREPVQQHASGAKREPVGQRMRVCDTTDSDEEDTTDPREALQEIDQFERRKFGSTSTDNMDSD